MQTDNLFKYSQKWSEIKFSIQRRQKPTFFKEGDLWWCSIGMNVGQEIFGKGHKFTRPVLVLKKLTIHLFLGIPLTTKYRQGDWYVETTHKNTKRWAILSQARALDGRRLTSRIGALNREELRNVQASFCRFYSPGQ